MVLAYQLTMDKDLLALPLEQHNKYHWFDINELLIDKQVHQFTKDYFLSQ